MSHDLVVIGAGPAGISAAVTAAELGLKTLVLDEQTRPGGQIYRNVSALRPDVARHLGPDYAKGASWVNRLDACGADIRYSAMVWDIADNLHVTALQDGHTFRVRPKQLILATGAMERPSPVPGWTLPGVMNAGAAQVAMKSGGFVPSGPIVLAGAGPLLLLVACQLVKAGARVVALLETAEATNHWRALKHLPQALRTPEYLFKGITMVAWLRAHRIARYRHVRDLQIIGTDRVQAIRFTAAGISHTLDAETVLLHHGVIPNHQMSRLLRVDHTWDPTQLAWRVVSDAYGKTSLPGVRVAGDSIAIAGAIAAEASGALAALGAAYDLGRIDSGELRKLSAAHRRKLDRHCGIRPFLDTLYRPPSFIIDPPDHVVVCRCEEVTAGRIREMASLGCKGPNQTKFFSRCGMGPCQGRVCGTVVTQILAEHHATSPDLVGAYRTRSPLKPISVAAIASLSVSATQPCAEYER